MYVGVTDFNWFNLLRQSQCEEVDFWKPGGRTNFRALEIGDLFLFKLHSPIHSPKDFIVGGGLFLKFSILPASLAWEAFGVENGVGSFHDLLSRIYQYTGKNRRSDPDPQIGCIILSSPFYFQEWIPVPGNWSRSIVQGKVYDSEETYGKELYHEIVRNLYDSGGISSVACEETECARYGKGRIIKPRIGQGTFRVFIADAYQRRCVVTGEKTLPVLEAVHIRPFSMEGPNQIRNGLLLRSDFHTLFDRGYITIDPSLHVEVSHRLKEDFHNGKEYYAYQGKTLQTLPLRQEDRPSAEYLEWHNENVFLG
jgi:putative restriction endonuclease